jgi:hypothetical protein
MIFLTRRPRAGCGHTGLTLWLSTSMYLLERLLLPPGLIQDMSITSSSHHYYRHHLDRSMVDKLQVNNEINGSPTAGHTHYLPIKVFQGLLACKL